MNALYLLAASVLLTSNLNAAPPLVTCVHNVASFRAALTAAKNNDRDDDIRLVAGNYDVEQVLVYMSGEPFVLTVSGGWGTGCSMITGAQTTLDGQNADQILRIVTHVASPINVNGLTFAHGFWSDGGDTYAGALSIQSAGDIRIESNFFLANTASVDGFSGALRVNAEGGASMYVRNNVLALNVAGEDGAGRLTAESGEQFITNNTIIFNQATSTNFGARIGGLDITNGSSSHFTLSNNLIWGNDEIDLYNRRTNGISMLNNDVGYYGGIPYDEASSGNMEVDPVFAAGLFNFHLSSHSPLINAGTNSPPGGAGLFDIDRNLRSQGPRIDIGAYESDVIFYNGLETITIQVP